MTSLKNYFTLLRHQSGTRERNLIMWISGAVFIILLISISFLQYRWIGQLNDTEMDRLNKNLRSSLERFSEDFDRELGRVFSAFEGTLNKDQDTLTAILNDWQIYQASAPFPELVGSVYLTEVRQGKEPDLYFVDTVSAKKVKMSWPSSFIELKKKIEMKSFSGNEILISIFQGLLLTDSTAFIVIPDANLEEQFESGKKNNPVRSLVIQFNTDFIKKTWIRSLAIDYFTTDGDLDYNFSIRDTLRNLTFFQTDSVKHPDLSWPVANLRTRDMIILTGNSARTKRMEIIKERAHAVSKFQSFSFSTSAGGKTQIQVSHPEPPDPTQEMPTVVSGPEAPAAVSVSTSGQVTAVTPVAPVVPVVSGQVTAATPVAPVTPVVVDVNLKTPAPKAQIENWSSVKPFSFSFTPETENIYGPTPFSTSGSGWVIQAAHISGSLTEAVNEIRMKNLMIGSGILLLLAGSIGFLLIASLKAWHQSRQQMEFVAGITHELRTPLAVIRSAAENLADGVVSTQESQAKYGRLIRDEGKRLSEMIEQVLDFSGLQSGRKNWTFTRVDVGDALEESVLGILEQAEQKSIKLEPHYLLDQIVYADRKAMLTIFRNLLENAVKYSHSPSIVIVRMQTDGKSVSVSIRDFGMGIPDEEKVRIFEPFFRGKTASEAQIHGNGLGLSLVQSLVTVNKGKISLKSEPGKGSEFVVSFPIDQKKGEN
ncbi:MAG: HAMP domain-containing histidine kinase [Bacteroidetes bacterium]|nr:HAMP domain-containing histidine kinase [Bacteroidota bacterium]